ncbi:MAG: phenylalanine--tRNA ligase subunit beta [Candidatus Buchananbacteria bacterium]
MNLNISYNWLKEYVKTNLTAHDFAKKLSLHGPSVDRIDELKQNFSKVVVGQIKEIANHPNADKLHVTKVDVGAKELLNIVCGAPNIKVGQKVPVVLVGGKVGDFEIKKSAIRGVESEGMMCSQKELGIGEDNSGIFILSDDTKIGLPLEKVMPLDDAILDIEITSNRPDAMCAIGLAREASTILEEKFLYKESRPDLTVNDTKKLTVTVKEVKLCPRYEAIVIDNVKVGPSPLWMQQRLMASGIRAINNLVDITNYILLEYGQPMHVFDYEKLEGNQIHVRLAKKGEKILALDGKEYELAENNLVIADAKNPVAVAGIMGGELSGATAETKTIVLESANFDPVSIRKTSRALNLASEGASLWEKGLSPENSHPSLLRAIELVQKLAGGNIASKIIDIKNYKFEPKEIKLIPENVNKVLGVEIKLPKMKLILQSLGFEVIGKTKEFKVKVPWWRDRDIEGEHDLIEEIARIYGYFNLPSNLMQGEIPISYNFNDQFYYENKLKEVLVGLGYSENYNYSFVSEKLINDCGEKVEDHVKIYNPLSSDFQYMRTSLLPSLMQSFSENSSFAEVKIFELSKAYINKESDLPVEVVKLSMICSVDSETTSFSQLKGALELIMSKLNISDYKLKSEKTSALWQDGSEIQILIGEKEIGTMGFVNQTTKQKIGIKKPFAGLELNFELLSSFAKTTPSYAPIAKFPSIDLDLSMEIGKEILFDEVATKVKNVDSLISNVLFMSLYEGDKIDNNKKALAIRITYRHGERTLELAEAQKIHDKVVELLKKVYNIKVR